MFGICATISCGLLFLLPQTIGRPVPQTIAEVLKKDMFDHVLKENIQFGAGKHSLPTGKSPKDIKTTPEEIDSGVMYKRL